MARGKGKSRGYYTFSLGTVDLLRSLYQILVTGHAWSAKYGSLDRFIVTPNALTYAPKFGPMSSFRGSYLIEGAPVLILPENISSSLFKIRAPYAPFSHLLMRFSRSQHTAFFKISERPSRRHGGIRVFEGDIVEETLMELGDAVRGGERRVVLAWLVVVKSTGYRRRESLLCMKFITWWYVGRGGSKGAVVTGMRTNERRFFFFMARSLAKIILAPHHAPKQSRAGSIIIHVCQQHGIAHCYPQPHHFIPSSPPASQH